MAGFSVSMTEYCVQDVSSEKFAQSCCKCLLFLLTVKTKNNCVFIYCSSLNIISCLWPTMVSLITDADHSTCTVAVAAAQARAGLADINMVHSPALPLSCPLLLNPAELGGPGNIQQTRLTWLLQLAVERTSASNYADKYKNTTLVKCQDESKVSK